MKFMEKLLVGEKVEWKKLGEVANCFSGGTPKTSNSSFYDGEIPWIRSGEINFNVIKKSERNITKEGLEKSSAKMIKKNSVVLAMTGATVGRTAVVEIETSSNQSVAAIETNNRIINYKYLFYFLAKEYNNLKKLGQGALTSLNLSIIKNIKIPVPSIETQEKIVKIFDSYTEYVTELQEKLKKELQARNKQYNYYRDMLLSEDYLNKISNKIFMQLDNVIHKTKLIEIAKLSRGKRLVRSELHENGQYPVFQNSLTPLGYYNNKNFDGGKTCIVTAGAAGEIFYQDRDFWAADDVLVITTDDILNKYLYYFLLNKQNLIKSKVRKASVPRLSRDDIEKIEVSLPPIEIQNKIVKILDRFQELLSDTKGLLPLEIEQRRKQYEYYREKLLTFDEGEGYALSTAQHSTAQHSTAQHSTAQRQITSKFFELLKEAAKVVSIDINDKVEWKTLSEVAKYSKDRISFEYLNEKNYVGVENLLKNRLGKIDSNNVPTEGNSVKFNMGDILIGNIRPYLCKIWLADIEGGTNGDVLVISIDKKHKNKILSRYLYQILSDEKFFDYNIKYSKGAKMPRGDKEKIMEYKIPLPPLPVQEYIVSILDKFDALVNDLSQGLPREIELRQKQYEYYREKLLNFEK
ncbi:restriction endonuclease subunit S [uncultured Leptotrichia sp.]|uniref:restriction endonuclease subunit S n=1 Tax=uncultured Leptotrichia sp. TaxID=159271 RepID=UPI0026129E3B|nr:restriction endonuclease subunit S [uncultured Leptotrichia sp.]